MPSVAVLFRILNKNELKKYPQIAAHTGRSNAVNPCRYCRDFFAAIMTNIPTFKSKFFGFSTKIAFSFFSQFAVQVAQESFNKGST